MNTIKHLLQNHWLALTHITLYLLTVYTTYSLTKNLKHAFILSTLIFLIYLPLIKLKLKLEPNYPYN